MFYDPMIAKLCTWAPNRIEAIEAMSSALDNFEVEGIGHNLPFLSAVMIHPRFRSGNITTAFIAEEWPDGFSGVSLMPDQSRVMAAIAAFAHVSDEARKVMISGTIANHKRRLADKWTANIDGVAYPLSIVLADNSAMVTFEENISHEVTTSWKPGTSHAAFTVDGVAFGVKIVKSATGWRLRWHGADMFVTVRSSRVEELSRWMPVHVAPDTSRMLLCPMPGIITSLLVEAGESVEAGQALATVEAMKMENVLRAEKRSVVTRVAVVKGQSLAVDELIMEFE